MQNGRILIVSDREQVIAELEPIIRAGEHLVMTVADGAEATRLLEEGVIPDVMISDLGSERALEAMEYVWHFRETNRVGRHLVVVEEGAPFSRGAFGGESVTPLPRPFHGTEVRETIEQSVAAMTRDLHALRGEMCREVSRLQREIRDAQRQMVHALALTVTARDPYMQGHCARVAELATKVAAVLHLPSTEIEMLETAAILHEMGKVGVPLELLHKTTPLGPSELAQIRVHTRVGAEIVRGVPSLKALAPIIEFQGTDHAELDRHLDPAAPEFLLTSILHLVDAYDAMTSSRSYREALPRRYWEAELRSGAGTKFHPTVVDAFFRVVGATPAPRPASRTA